MTCRQSQQSRPGSVAARKREHKGRHRLQDQPEPHRRNLAPAPGRASKQTASEGKALLELLQPSECGAAPQGFAAYCAARALPCRLSQKPSMMTAIMAKPYQVSA